MGGRSSKTTPSQSCNSFKETQIIIDHQEKKDSLVVPTPPKEETDQNKNCLTPQQSPRPRLRKKSTNLDPLYYKGEEYNPALKQSHRRRGSSTSSNTTTTIEEENATENKTDTNSLNQIKYENYEYPFENAVFEGGGVKGMAYAGAIRELESIGVWKNVKRFAGTSAGSMWAALAALGYTSYEVEAFLRQDLRKQFLDARCGYCSILPNLKKHFGWHPGRKIFTWFGHVIEEKTGYANITFKELYDLTGSELCVAVTNVNMMDVEYCHMKTTPTLPIRIAVRMSMAIPGLFGAVKYKRYGRTDIFVDGGLLCNYPIHCFDGWWLSMKNEDSFLRRMRPLNDLENLWRKEGRFGEYNNKTVGMVLYSSDHQQSLMVNKMDRLYNQEPPKRPNTKLSKDRLKKQAQKDVAALEYQKVVEAFEIFFKVLDDSQIDQNMSINREELERAFTKYQKVVEAFEIFFKVLDDSQIDQNMSINREELERAFTKSEFTDEHVKTLFGNNQSVSEIFDSLDINRDGEINFNELVAFAQRKGVGIQNMFQGYDRREINSVVDFLRAVQDTMLVNVKRVFMTEEDVERTIAIDTLYIGTTDWDMEEEDKSFLIQQGQNAARSFLRHYVKQNDPPLKRSFCADSKASTKSVHE